MWRGSRRAGCQISSRFGKSSIVPRLLTKFGKEPPARFQAPNLPPVHIARRVPTIPVLNRINSATWQSFIIQHLFTYLPTLQTLMKNWANFAIFAEAFSSGFSCFGLTAFCPTACRLPYLPSNPMSDRTLPRGRPFIIQHLFTYLLTLQILMKNWANFAIFAEAFSSGFSCFGLTAFCPTACRLPYLPSNPMSDRTLPRGRPFIIQHLFTYLLTLQTLMKNWANFAIFAEAFSSGFSCFGLTAFCPTACRLMA